MLDDTSGIFIKIIQQSMPLIINSEMDSFIMVVRKAYTILFEPLKNSILELVFLFIDNFRQLLIYLCAIIATFLAFSCIGYYSLALRSLKWVLLGIASSIGFGFGMHTFVLFLAPHIAAVTMAAQSCRSLDFPEPPYPDEIICPDQVDHAEITFFKILQKIGLESFMWGLGTAIGELPPYLAARIRARAMGRCVGGDGQDNTPVASWELWMIKIIKKVGFIGILLCAAIPNPLFDAAGVASGIAQIPFLSFFGATLIGKAVIKVLIQSSFVILSFHKNNLEAFVLNLNRRLGQWFPIIQDLNIDKTLTIFLDEQRGNVLKKRIGERKQISTIGFIFNWIIFICCALFIMSLINALDKQYRERRVSKKVRRME